MNLDTPAVAGLHHVTLVAADAAANVAFYAGRLGLRLVKRTVNFDDPTTHHLYYGDGLGSPGTILTFFPYEGARQGVRGRGQVAAVALAVPPGSLGFWAKRLADLGPERFEAFGAAGLRLADPDGVELHLVEADDDTPHRLAGGGVPAAHAVRGVHAVTLWVGRPDATIRVLHELGFTESGRAGDVVRLTATATTGRHVDVRTGGDVGRGIGGAGTAHHVAFRVGNDAGEAAARERMVALGLSPTGVIDRQYFRSVYFREPGGVLFELATDAPGFAADEPAEALGEKLMLPPHYEADRPAIEAALPPLERPEAGGFVYRWLPTPGARRTLLLLHGTGGTEGDLLPLAAKLDPSAAVLSPQGRVDEHGAARFFRRLRERVFDEASVISEADALADFVAEQADNLGFDANAVDAVGYSNGANIAAAVLLRRPGVLRSAILLRPMVPLVPEVLPDLAGTRVLILAGRHDPISSPEHAKRVAKWLGDAGADVRVEWQNADHHLVPGDLEAAHNFYTRA